MNFSVFQKTLEGASILNEGLNHGAHAPRPYKGGQYDFHNKGSIEKVVCWI